MNAIEQKLIDATWVYNQNDYTSVFNGYGWLIFTYKNQLWLSCISPDIVKKQQKIHETKGNVIVHSLNYGLPSIKLRFKIPVTNDFLAHVIESANPEIF